MHKHTQTFSCSLEVELNPLAKVKCSFFSRHSGSFVLVSFLLANKSTQ